MLAVMRRICLLGLGVCMLTGMAVAQDAFVDRGDKHFSVRLYPGKATPKLASRLADECWSAVERAAKVIKKAWRLPERPVVIHVYLEREGFDAAAKEHGSQYPYDAFLVGNAAAVIAMAPQLPLETLSDLGLPETVTCAIIEQAARAVAAQSDVGAVATWPCEVFGAGMMEAAINPSGKDNVNLLFDQRSVTTSNAGESRDSLEVYAVLMGPYGRLQLGLGLPDRQLHLGNASWAARTCAKASRSWAKKLLTMPQKLKALGKGSPDSRTVHFAVMNRALGKNPGKVEKQFLKLRERAEPTWARDRGLAAKRDGRVLLAGDAANLAQIIYQPKLPKGPFVVRAKVQFAAGEDPGLRVVLDWDGKTTVGALIRNDACAFAISKDGKWQQRVSEDHKLPIGRVAEVAVEVASELRILVDGQVVVSRKCPERDMHRGLTFATNDSVVWLEDIRVEKLRSR